MAINPIIFRPAESEDAPAVLTLVRQLAEFENLAHQVKAQPSDIRDLLFGSQPRAEVILAELDGEPIGFALFYTTFSTFRGRRGLHLEDLFVVPEHRGLGIGQQLLSRFAAEAVRRGYGHLQWQVLQWNERAIQFYQSLGAEPVDGWITYRLEGEAIERLADES